MEMLSRKLLDLQNQLIQWERMAVLGEMAASVAHDIRNPLVSIGGFARRLKMQIQDDEKESRYAEIIIQEVDRLERTLENVMSYTRAYGMTERKPSRLYGLLSECAELFSEHFRKKQVELRRQFEGDIPEIWLDERQIKQAVINVLFNAGEAAGEGSEVTLSARMGETDQGDFVIIDVSDEGGGIAEGDLKKVFKPFFTTKAAGTGLGLAIALRAVTGHGGEIRVDNRRGEGVTFSIYLPAAPLMPEKE
jgi:signal transduction histidine kinase